MTRVYLIRHADVENPRRVLYGHLDGFPLSAGGREQATLVGRRLHDSGIRRIVHSPLERALETACLIAAELPPPVDLIPEPDLREAEFSRYLQGVPFWQIPVRRPLWVVHKARRGLLPGDEPVRQLGGRVVAVMQRVAAAHPDEVAALVSHADPLQAAWVLMEGRSHSERELYRKPVDRAGVLEVDIEAGVVIGVAYVAPPKADARAAQPAA
ncbi:MAG: histidine phosphatase family protein [Candidatus Dormibacteraeota bacterium]|nr:histidine phosphatase family protein [Candidatus Dormibacteraeota bacterium]